MHHSDSEQKTTKHTQKKSLVKELVRTPDKLMLLTAVLNIARAGAPGASSTDTPDLAQLTALCTRFPA
jgi:hypothetical protein